uniref:Uncharacterized protein n=1 Tax=Arundo donax TaxID=35708 RepID=A0A0A9GZ30_ARUDO
MKKQGSSHPIFPTKHLVGVDWCVGEVVCHKSLIGFFTVSVYEPPGATHKLTFQSRGLAK